MCSLHDENVSTVQALILRRECDSGEMQVVNPLLVLISPFTSIS